MEMLHEPKVFVIVGYLYLTSQWLVLGDMFVKNEVIITVCTHPQFHLAARGMWQQVNTANSQKALKNWISEKSDACRSD